MADERETVWPIIQKFWFVIIPAKVLGLLPLRIRGNKLTREGLLARMCSIFLVIFSSCITIRYLLPKIGNLKRYDLGQILNPSFVLTLTWAGHLLVVISDVYREFTDAHTGLKIIKSLALNDRKVKQLGLARKDHFLFSWIISLPIIAVLLAPIIRKPSILELILYTGVSMKIRRFGLMIMRLTDYLARLKFSIILHLLYQRYNHLNEIVLPKDEWRMRGNLALNRRSVNMSDLVYLHSTLTRATQSLIKVYSFELLVWVISPIWEFLGALNHLRFRLMYGIEGFTEAAQILIAIWCLCWICETTANEANKFAMQILKTDPELIHARDIDEQLDAALYMYNNKISFRLLNLFDVNLPTIVFIGTMTLSLGSVISDGKHDVGMYKTHSPA